MHLLDLPEDILQSVLAHVTHTNDLTALALTHSTLHDLVIPHIYSRFDIVWPEANSHVETRVGVDALTYGLATLCMAEEVFGEAPHQRQSQGNRFAPSGKGIATPMAIRRRRGNHYAQFTRKFSLGNGPADWVQEYPAKISNQIARIFQYPRYSYLPNKFPKLRLDARIYADYSYIPYSYIHVLL